MSEKMILIPVLLQVLLTLAVFIVLAKRKKSAVAGGTVDREAAALNNQAWPVDVVLASNNIANQFQIPVLFYTLCLMAFSAGLVDSVLIGLAWVFAVSRLGHAYVHIGSNFVPNRMKIFLVGVFTIIVMTVYLGFKLMVS